MKEEIQKINKILDNISNKKLNNDDMDDIYLIKKKINDIISTKKVEESITIVKYDNYQPEITGIDAKKLLNNIKHHIDTTKDDDPNKIHRI